MKKSIFVKFPSAHFTSEISANQRFGTHACYQGGYNLVPKVVSEPLFQSSSQKTTLAQGMELSNLIGYFFEWWKVPKTVLTTPGPQGCDSKVDDTSSSDEKMQHALQRCYQFEGPK